MHERAESLASDTSEGHLRIEDNVLRSLVGFCLPSSLVFPFEMKENVFIYFLH